MSQLFPYILYRISGIEYDIWEKNRLQYSGEDKKSIVFREQYSNKLMALRQSMQTLAQHPNFTESLPYSSLIFAETVKKWTAINPVDFKKKERKILRSALKYLTRISTKTSPFGTFTTLQLIDNQGNNINSDARLKSPNIKLLDAIGAYMIADARIQSHLYIRLNPSWVIYDYSDDFVFIQNENNGETLQMIEKDSVVLFLLEAFSEKETLLFSDLVALVDNENAVRFLMDMIDVGIVVWEFPFEKNFDGFQQVKAFLSAVPNISDEILTLLALLEKIEKSKNIDLDFSFLNNSSEANYIDFDYFKNRKEEQYYLDATSNFADLGKKNLDFIPFYKKTGELFDLLQAVAQPLHSDYLQLFIKNNLLKEKREEIPFTEFYHKILHHEDLHNVSHYRNESEKILTFVKENCELSEANEVHLSPDFLKNLAAYMDILFPKNKKEKGKKLPKLQLGDLPSYNLLLQPYVENGEPKAILNGASIGFGKQFGRFLSLFDKKVSDAFIEKNKQHHVVLAELDDASFFNGNMHQKLHQHSISAPSHQYQNEHKIHPNSLVIKKIDNDWLLWNKDTQQLVVPIDMGIEHPAFRSPFLQLLNQFSYQIANFRMICQLINFSFEAPLLARIVIDNCLVIQRKTWFFDIKTIPSLDRNGVESDFFIAINQWKQEKNLPNRIFVSIPPDQNFEAEDNSEAQPQRDDYKPQYIDFENILLVSLLARILKKVPQSLKIEEMLPDESALWALEGRKYMVEAVVQFDF